jgi:hypothetical protein
VETLKKYYKVDRRDISFLRFIFEGYDGIALVTTINADQGVIQLSIAPGCMEEVESVLNKLKTNILIEQTECNRANTDEG